MCGRRAGLDPGVHVGPGGGEAVVLLCMWGGTLTRGSVSSVPGSASPLEQMFRAVTALWTLHGAAHVDLAACAGGSRAGICARHLCDPVRGPPLTCHCQGSTRGQSPAQSVVVPKITATETMAVRASAHLVLLAAPAAGACCSRCPQFSPLKTQELSHFLNLHGWQVAEQDENQAQDLGLCCPVEGRGLGVEAM